MPDAAAPFDLETVDRLLATTRAVRRRLDLARPVPRDVILRCIELSQQAPTASNRQDWRWVVVTDPGLRRELGAIYGRGRKAIERYVAGDAELAPQSRRVFDSATWLLDHLAEVPALVLPCLARRPSGTSPALMASVYGSIFPAVWSFQLALRSRGLGSALTTLHLAWEADVAALLGIPETAMQVALLPVAWTRGTGFRAARRPPADSITGFDRWPD